MVHISNIKTTTLLFSPALQQTTPIPSQTARQSGGDGGDKTLQHATPPNFLHTTRVRWGAGRDGRGKARTQLVNKESYTVWYYSGKL